MTKLNGFTLRQARNFLTGKILPLIGGLYRDEFWRGAKKVWDFLGANDIDYSIVSAEYKKDRDKPLGPDTSKTWVVEIPFVDAKGKAQVITGHLTAHGAGSVKDPLDAYDLTMSIF